MAKVSKSVQTPRRGKIKYIVIHCTAGSMNATAREVEQICLNRKNADGTYWQRCGYHYIITKDGKEHQILPDNCISNGVAGMNNVCLNIAYTGGVLCNSNGTVKNERIAKDTRNQEQKKTLFDLVKRLKNKYPEAKICGHNMFANKACPSFNVAAEFGNLYPDSVISKKSELAGKQKKNEKHYKAHKSEVDIVPQAIESVVRPVREIRDTIYETCNNVYQTYNSMIETLKSVQKPIGITAPDIKGIFIQQIEAQKQQITELAQLPGKIGNGVEIVPEDVEIPEDESIKAFLTDVGGLAAMIAGMITVGGSVAGSIAGGGSKSKSGSSGSSGSDSSFSDSPNVDSNGNVELETNITDTSINTSNGESSNSVADDLMSQLPSGDSSDNDAAINASIEKQLEKQPPTDISKTEKEEIKLLVESVAKSSPNIVKYEEQLKQLYANTDDEELYIDLYTDARLAILEIFPELKEGDSMNKNSVNPASLFALKITPALIKYINSKVEKIEKKIEENVMAQVQAKLATLTQLGNNVSSETNT